MKNFVKMESLIVCMMFLIILVGCQKERDLSSNQNSQVLSYKEIAEQIAIINIYEITENQFQEGIDYYFTSEEMELWRNILNNEIDDYSNVDIGDVEIKYIINFYNKDGDELLSFALDEDKNVYTEDGYKFINSEILLVLKNIL